VRTGGKSGAAWMFQRQVGLLPSNVPFIKSMTDGHHDQQQSVPRLWCADDKPGAVHEVLPHQSRWAGGVAPGAIAPGVQAPARWGAMQKLHTLEGAVFARVSRGWDTRGGGALLR
jgi:hypothetical protein